MSLNSFFHLLLPLLFGLGLGVSQAGASELVVIVSAKNPLDALSAAQVAEIFLADANRFPNGVAATAIDQSIGAPLRDEFYARVTGKSPALLKAHWTKIVFTGRGKPPQALASNLAVRKMVAANPGLIGYIDKAALDDSVKSVLVLP